MRTLALAVAILALTGCPLRPRYAEFVGKESTQPVKLQVVEKKSGMPVPEALVEVGESRGKVSLRTDAQGFFTLPVDKRLLDDNALIVVTAPKGTGRTIVMGAALEVAAPVGAAPMEATEAADAGVSTY